MATSASRNLDNDHHGDSNQNQGGIMKTINEYLDDLKAKTGSDYKSAQAMGVDRSVITNMRKRSAMADENAIKVAELLEIDPSEILIVATLARCDGRVKEAWLTLSKRAGIAASIAVAMMMTSGFSTDAEASVKTVENIHYAKPWESLFLPNDFFEHPSRKKIGKNYATAYAFGAPIRPRHVVSTQQGG